MYMESELMDSILTAATYRQRFSAVKLLLDAVSRVLMGSMLSFLEPTRLPSKVTIFKRLTSSRPSNDWRNAPMSLAATF